MTGALPPPPRDIWKKEKERDFACSLGAGWQVWRPNESEFGGSDAASCL